MPAISDEGLAFRRITARQWRVTKSLTISSLRYFRSPKNRPAPVQSGNSIAKIYLQRSDAIQHQSMPGYHQYTAVLSSTEPPARPAPGSVTHITATTIAYRRCCVEDTLATKLCSRGLRPSSMPTLGNLLAQSICARKQRPCLNSCSHVWQRQIFSGAAIRYCAADPTNASAQDVAIRHQTQVDPNQLHRQHLPLTTIRIQSPAHFVQPSEGAVMIRPRLPVSWRLRQQSGTCCR